MDVKDYVQRAEKIRIKRIMSRLDFSHESRIHPLTFTNIMKKPETCSLITMQKLRSFVLKWEDNNMSVQD